LIENGLTSPPTQYRLSVRKYDRSFLVLSLMLQDQLTVYAVKCLFQHTSRVAQSYSSVIQYYVSLLLCHFLDLAIHWFKFEAVQ